MNSRSAGIGGVFVGVIMLLGILALGANLFLNAVTPDTVSGYREQDINMIQPSGLSPLDRYNAEINDLNSGANLNNKTGEAELIRAEGEYQESLANACATRNDCHSPYGTIPMSGGSLLLVIVVSIVAGIFIVIGFLRKISSR